MSRSLPCFVSCEHSALLLLLWSWLWGQGCARIWWFSDAHAWEVSYCTEAMLFCPKCQCPKGSFSRCQDLVNLSLQHAASYL